MTRFVTSAAAGTAALLTLVASALASSGITNGSFETNGPAEGDWWWHIWGGFNGNAIQGWTVPSGYSVDLVVEGQRGWPASDGIRSIDLDGDFPGAIQQDLTTVPGQFYAARFDLSGNPDPDTYPNGPPGWTAVRRVQVSASGAPSQIFSYDVVANGNTRSDMKYETHNYAFLATSTTTTIRFTSLSNAGWWGPVLDNVRLVSGADACKNEGWQTLADTAANTFKNQGDCVSFFATEGKNLGAGE